ncbi:MAG: polyprenol monophosphomannose synthase [Patescibacteria group bacterium]|nr:polyprenol monophosphomannose synthase [Patescibacteria group bacterium]
MSTTIIIPTYNEADNIGPLIDSLEKILTNFIAEQEELESFNILVVDSNSPDGTGDVVREKIKEFDNLRIISGPKQGLGADTIRGIRYALEKLEADVVVTMDADFSHNPEDVPRLVSKVLNGADYVIGSRYVEGGSIPSNWGLHRKFLSFFGNLLARILGVWEVHDQTPAFRAMRREVLEKIDFEGLPDGYAFQIGLVCRAHGVGAKFAEVPIHFTDRERGQSKMPVSTILDTLGFLVNYRLTKIFGEG